MKCNNILFSGHALVRMFERGLTREDVITSIYRGDTISDYPEDQPYPSQLLLGIVKNKPIHVVVAQDMTDYSCYVVTAYIPSMELWQTDFKTRKP